MCPHYLGRNRDPNRSFKAWVSHDPLLRYKSVIMVVVDPDPILNHRSKNCRNTWLCWNKFLLYIQCFFWIYKLAYMRATLSFRHTFKTVFTLFYIFFLAVLIHYFLVLFGCNCLFQVKSRFLHPAVKKDGLIDVKRAFFFFVSKDLVVTDIFSSHFKIIVLRKCFILL